MRKKLTNEKEIVPVCKNCIYGTMNKEASMVLCEKTGIRNPDSFCKKFKYDPLSRVPLEQKSIDFYSVEDFQL